MITDEQIDFLLNKLNDLAQERDFYEYGLPTVDREEFYTIVREWFSQQSVKSDLPNGEKMLRCCRHDLPLGQCYICK